MKTVLSLAMLLIAAAALSRASAQTTRATIIVEPKSSTVMVEASVLPAWMWSFPDVYGGVIGLARRVQNFHARDREGKEIAARSIAAGQFASESAASQIKYEMSLAPPTRASDAALVSWLDRERGVLMLGDLFPSVGSHEKQAVSVRLTLPPEWTAYSVDGQSSGDIKIDNFDDATIALGKNLRVSNRTILGKRFDLVSNAQWAFSDDEALDLVDKILQLHSEVAGKLPCERAAVVLLPFPQVVSANRWSAQTRGCAVTLLMGKLPSKVAATSQLGLALTHELFHLWIPNGVALSGDYDWFYEGFTMYQAGRAGVRLGMLTFQQFLNAIADAYNATAFDTEKLSLIEASKRRWTTGAGAVYSRAMVVAFLVDLNLRSQSKGKRSLDDVYRKIIREHFKGGAEVDGDDAAISALRNERVSDGLIDKFVAGTYPIDLKTELMPVGLNVDTLGLRAHILVDERLSSRQRDLLRQLGYNEPRRR